MILVDANLLLYAYHPRAEQHAAARAWLEAALSGPELVRFAWLTNLGVSQNRDESPGLRAAALDR
jgi:predicted nucleic acid-binding protein